MAAYTYIGDAGRVYYPPGQPAVTPDVGGTYDLPDLIDDGRWIETGATPTPQPEPSPEPPSDPTPEPDPAPAGDNQE